MKVDAVKTSPPFGISMLSVQMWLPVSTTVNSTFGLSIPAATSPDHAIAAQTFPVARSSV